MSASIMPGATTFTRMPNRLASLARALVKPMIPPLAAHSPPSGAPLCPASPYTPETDEIVTIWPRRRFIIGSTAARHRLKTPSRLVSMTARQSSSCISASGLSLAIPAQITTAPTGPSSSSTALTQAVTAPGSVTSAWVASTRAPSSPAAFSTSRAACSSH